MTFFEQELKKLFADDTAFMDKRFIGNACYGRLDNNIRIKIRFTTCGVADQYEALKVTLLNRNEGEIDNIASRLPFNARLRAMSTVAGAPTQTPTA